MKRSLHLTFSSRARKRLISGLILIFLLPVFIFANNIQVTNVSLEGQNFISNTYQVRFDLSWENSWRTSTLESNWDAAWVVVKYRVLPSTNWLHAYINTTGSVFPEGLTGEFGGTTGVFIHRSADGIGHLNETGIELRWPYGANFEDDAIVEICVLAIEMVYVPDGSFMVGDDSPNADANFQAGITTNPYNITSENSITLGGISSANLNVLNNSNFPIDDYNSATTQTLPTAFPKGFAGFYIMKYEISQQQYVDFLNKLPPTATVNRYDETLFEISGYMITDTAATPNIFVTTTPDRPCNYLNWPDIAAYADWIGLRPMTELEYEKACRGPLAPAPDEGAWGSSFVANQPYTIVNEGLPNERISNPATGTGNVMFTATYGGINIPRRCGILAASAINKTREETGGSYYGVMELSGNLWEPTITTGNIEGRQFTGLHGNGVINAAGQATVGSTWPSVTLFPIADGTGLRGGSSVSSANRIAVSNRDLSNFDVISRFSDVGGRLVRTAN